MIYFLQPHTFFFVSCCANSFAGEVDWVYCCSCDSARAEVVDFLGPYIQVPIQEFEKQLTCSTTFNISLMNNIGDCMTVKQEGELGDTEPLSAIAKWRQVHNRKMKSTLKVRNPRAVFMTCIHATSCLHITAMKTILSDIDAIHDILPSLQFTGWHFSILLDEEFNNL